VGSGSTPVSVFASQFLGFPLLLIIPPLLHAEELAPLEVRESTDQPQVVGGGLSFESRSTAPSVMEAMTRDSVLTVSNLGSPPPPQIEGQCSHTHCPR
jgi:hypothetical protein